MTILHFCLKVIKLCIICKYICTNLLCNQIVDDLVVLNEHKFFKIYGNCVHNWYCKECRTIKLYLRQSRFSKECSVSRHRPTGSPKLISRCRSHILRHPKYPTNKNLIYLLTRIHNFQRYALEYIVLRTNLVIQKYLLYELVSL